MRSGTATARLRLWMRRIVTIPALIFLAALVCVLVAPYVLCTPPVTNRLLATANARLPGRVSLEGWRLGWHRNIVVKGLHYKDGQAGIDCAVALVHTEKSLWRIVGSRFNIGLICVVQPTLRLKLLDAPETPPRRAPPPPSLHLLRARHKRPLRLPLPCPCH